MINNNYIAPEGFEEVSPMELVAEFGVDAFSMIPGFEREPEFNIEQTKPSTAQMKEMQNEMAYADKIDKHEAKYKATPNPARREQDYLMNILSSLQNKPSSAPRDNALMRAIGASRTSQNSNPMNGMGDGIGAVYGGSEMQQEPASSTHPMQTVRSAFVENDMVGDNIANRREKKNF